MKKITRDGESCNCAGKRPFLGRFGPVSFLELQQFSDHGEEGKAVAVSGGLACRPAAEFFPLLA